MPRVAFPGTALPSLELPRRGVMAGTRPCQRGGAVEYGGVLPDWGCCADTARDMVSAISCMPVLAARPAMSTRHSLYRRRSRTQAT